MGFIILHDNYKYYIATGCITMADFLNFLFQLGDTRCGFLNVLTILYGEYS